MHSFMLVRHGQVIAEGWWKPRGRGQAARPVLAEQELHLDRRRAGDRRGKAEPRRSGAEVLPRRRAGRAFATISRRCASATCSRMTSGPRDRAANARPTRPWVKTFLAQPVPFKPGTHFLYNTPGTLHALRDRQEGDRPDGARLPQAAALRAARHREPDVGRQPAGQLARRLRA